MMRPINRVKEIIKYKGVSISAFEKNTGMSNNSIQVALKKEARLKDETLNSILNTYPDISPEWLLTGKGPMLRPVEAMEEAPQTLEEPRSGYGKAREVNPAICSACEERERIIASKDKEIASLERQIEGLKAGFENQIEDLKSNLERLISEKSEVVKMKDAMLAMKDEMLEIQAKKIAELEDFKKMQEEQMRKQRSA